MSWRAGDFVESHEASVSLFNEGWSFYRSEPGVEPEAVWELADAFRPVDIPHDWLIYDVKDLYRDGTGWYRKSFPVQKEKDTRVILRFEGVYMDCTVYLNRRKVLDWKYGYSTFDTDLTDYLEDGENELLVQVRFLSPNSRWYSGAGIYRNVWKKVCGVVWLPLDGTYVRTREREDGVWELRVSTEVEGDAEGRREDGAGSGYACVYELWRQGELVQSLGEAKVSNGRAEVSALVKQPFLWDVEKPNRYQLHVALQDASGRQLDADRVTVGFRTLTFTTDQGFFLNHRHLKLHGVCEHHDLGCLGAAFHKEAMRRKFMILKEMGVNALRTSHNMPAPELMDLADEMGILVVDEAFDMWELSKTEYDYARFFPEWAERDVASWVRRDRNHPCLLMWSIGNEIYDTHVSEYGQEITRRLVGYVKEHDPEENARVTIGSNYMPWENARKCADIVKLAGYNYGEMYYDAHHKEHPDWTIYGSETASIVQSRGVYHFPLAQSCLSEVDEQCSSLGNSTTSYGAQSLELLITRDRDCAYSMGQFLWTGFDYIGEPTPYHTKNSYFGQIDTAGFPKDAYYVFQSDWRSAEDCPMVHLFPYWDWNEGQTVDVLACTTGESVELFVNGASKGRQDITHHGGDKLLAKWQVVYEPGEILAVAYDGEGREIARESHASFGESAAIVLEADKRVFRADGEDLCFLAISMKDREGHPVENAADYVTVHVSGPGRLLGLDNGDSTDHDEYKTNCRKLFQGKLLAVIGSVREPGEITVRVEACGAGEKALGIQSASLHLWSVDAPSREGVSYAENCDAGPREDTAGQQECMLIPVRKAELMTSDPRKLTPKHPKAVVEARLLPENTTEREFVWEAVNDAGIPLHYVEVTAGQTDASQAVVEAKGDGSFRVRCLVKTAEGGVRVISQLEFEAEGFGQAFLDPYDFVSAGLFSDTVGIVTNGNEKGIATSSDVNSGAIYDRLDFGEYGSDTLTMEIFTLNDHAHPIEVWEGRPDTGDGSSGTGRGRLIDTVIYQKPSIWNVYQEETWQLPEKLKGVRTLSFMTDDKMHLKGFSFKRLEKAYQKLTGAECSQVYGDSFTVDGDSIRDIGNNVTVVYDGLDFAEGADTVTIWGSTPLPVNTIHLLFTPENGPAKRIIAEFNGNSQQNSAEQTFAVEDFCGRGRLELVFLPGSHFTLEALQFSRK